MSRMTYFSPAMIGAAFAAMMLATYWERLPIMNPWLFWLLMVGGCVLAGAMCQLAMVGAQGAFAQVLPMPGGRSIRGGGAVLAGWLLLLSLVLNLAALMLGLESGLGRPTIVAAAAGQVLAVAALATYLWCWPTATRDFADER